MKKIIKKILVFMVLLVCCMPLSACQEPVSIISISKTKTEGNVDTYTILYSDNTTYEFQITNGVNGLDGQNGKDGEDGTVLTVTDFYEEWKKTVPEGEDNSFDAFLEKYLTVEEDVDVNISTSKALRSVVSVRSVFNYTRVTGGYWTPEVTEDYQAVSAGSGVIIKMSEEDKEQGNAYVVTNYHVVYDVDSTDENNISKDIRLYLYGLETDNTVINATYVGGSMTYDIAVLKVENSEILKNSIALEATVSDTRVSVSQDVMAIGNPEGLGISVSKGIVSVEEESIEMTLPDGYTTGQFRVVRVDAPVNPGNSGGGLFDMNGDLLGIVNAKLVDSSIDSIGYAIPNEVALTVANNIIENCNGTTSVKPKIARIGLLTGSYGYETYYDSETNTIKIRERNIVMGMTEGGLAEVSGFKLKDIILSCKYNGEEIIINRSYDLTNLILSCDENSVLEFTVSRIKNPDSSIDLSDENVYYPNATYEEETIRVNFNSNYIFEID